MNEENKDAGVSEASSAPETPDATTPQPEEETPKVEAGPQAEDGPKAEWKFKKTLGINEEMKKVINLTLSATQSEIAVLRRKLERLTYGA